MEKRATEDPSSPRLGDPSPQGGGSPGPPPSTGRNAERQTNPAGRGRRPPRGPCPQPTPRGTRGGRGATDRGGRSAEDRKLRANFPHLSLPRVAVMRPARHTAMFW